MLRCKRVEWSFAKSTWVAAMDVCFSASGRVLTVLDADEFEGKPAAVRQSLAAQLGTSRFKQKFFVEDSSSEIQDDEVVASGPLKVQLMVLEFWPLAARWKSC